MGYIYSRNAESQFYYQCTTHNIRDTEITPQRDPGTESKQMKANSDEKRKSKSINTMCELPAHFVKPLISGRCAYIRIFAQEWTSALSYITEDIIVYTVVAKHAKMLQKCWNYE